MPETTTVSHVESARDTALAELAAAETDGQIEAWRIAWLGRRGQLTQVLRGIRDLSPEERRSVGAAANRAKNALEQSLAQRRDDVARAKSEAEGPRRCHRCNAAGLAHANRRAASDDADDTRDMRRVRVDGLRRRRGAGGRVGPL